MDIEDNDFGDDGLDNSVEGTLDITSPDVGADSSLEVTSDSDTTAAPPAEPSKPLSLREQLEQATKRPYNKKEPAAAPAPVAPSVLAADAVPVPNSWNKETKAMWANLPREVQLQVATREQEATQAIQGSKDARAVTQGLFEIHKPYMQTFQQAGLHPMEAIQTAFGAFNTFLTGDDKAKAKLIVDMIDQYNIPMDALNHQLNVLPDPNAAVLSKISSLEQQLKQQYAPQQQAPTAQVTPEAMQMIDAFEADPANEYFADVIGDMVELAALPRFKNADMKTVYDAACSMNKTVQGKIQAKAQAAKQRQAAGNLSLKPRGPNNANGPAIKGSLRSQIDALIPKDFQ